MSIDLETTKTIATIAAPFTGAIVETWLKPKLQQLYKRQKTDKEIFLNDLSSKFDEYLQRSFDRHAYLTVLIFQNQQKRLREIYLPLHVKSAKDNKVFKIDNYKDEFIPAYKNVLITDPAGMGKSTVMKFLFLSCIEDNKGIPIFIELRKLSKDNSVLNNIYSDLNPIDDRFDEDFVLKLIKRGDFIFFLDGYDEIPFDQREEVTYNLQDFISKANNSCFIMTSRPESSLASFPDFQRFNIEPLKVEEAYELIRKYDQAGTLSEEIISKIQGQTLKDIQEFLVNPLLVSLLYKSYEYKATIPFKKHLFYRQVYDSLFESHDLTKGGFKREKYSNLDVDDFHRVLRVLGFITVKLGQIEFDRDKLTSLLKESKEHIPGIEFKEAQFIQDLITTVPLFNRDGNYYRWAHKSLQEYFAAQFICRDAKGDQDNILRAMYWSVNNEKYINVLDLCYDIDYKSFRRTVIYEVLNDFLKYYESAYDFINTNQISERDINERKLLTFSNQYILLGRESILSLTSRNPKKTDFDKLIKHGFNLDEIPGNNILIYRLPEHTEAIAYRKPVASILELLKAKNESFIVTRKKSGWSDLGLKIKKPLVINEDPQSRANKKAMFKKVNEFLLGFETTSIDINKCRELIAEIEEEIKKERASGGLVSGI